tara:strand:- start:28 stop:234 length:207 start_codon:yes stop_codon:yes gene_type:complete
MEDNNENILDIDDLMKESKGLGDTIHKITTATGIKKVVDKISEKTGKPCGCGQRRKALNKMFPYGNKK